MFLPQFHRDERNDEWWGPGFTEWNNVRASRPLFDGHKQPRLPVNGEFDLTEPGEIHAQSLLAQAAGLTGFAVYDYWHSGTRLLRRPLDLVRANPSIDFRYCLVWANHSWTRTWTNRAGAGDVLIEQTYPREVDARHNHFEHLGANFTDPRYVRIDGRPVYCVYDPMELSMSDGYIDDLREWTMSELGLDLYLVGFVNRWTRQLKFLDDYDAASLFQPSFGLFSPAKFSRLASPRILLRSTTGPTRARLLRAFGRHEQQTEPKLFSYPDYVRTASTQYESYKSAVTSIHWHPMASVGFDNSPRYGNRARILRGWTQSIFEAHLCDVVADDSRISFFNSWNEWGEGAHLQPDTVDRGARLESVGRVLG